MKKRLFPLLCLVVTGFLLYRLWAGPEETTLPVSEYYAYDRQMPLDDSVRPVTDTTAYDLYYVTYRSVHDRQVTALLSVPVGRERPLPVVLLLHGLGDRKTVDYVEAGNRYFLDAGYAVMRIDICCHGDRKTQEWEFDLTGPNRYRTREMMSQTVFDLRRALDFLATRPEVDTSRIGFFGISLGGIIGTIFCGVDDRVRVPVIVLAGGRMNLMFGKKALSKETRNYLSIIDPINFVQMISPRPLLMINAEHDDIVPPITSRLLYRKARKPKRIIWYDARHHTLPINKAYPAAISWFETWMPPDTKQGN